jgi:hypothetical protein
MYVAVFTSVSMQGFQGYVEFPGYEPLHSTARHQGEHGNNVVKKDVALV